jgi:hypothetical protein
MTAEDQQNYEALRGVIYMLAVHRGKVSFETDELMKRFSIEMRVRMGAEVIVSSDSVSCNQLASFKHPAEMAHALMVLFLKPAATLLKSLGQIDPEPWTRLDTPNTPDGEMIQCTCGKKFATDDALAMHLKGVMAGSSPGHPPFPAAF